MIFCGVIDPVAVEWAVLRAVGQRADLKRASDFFLNVEPRGTAGVCMFFANGVYMLHVANGYPYVQQRDCCRLPVLLHEYSFRAVYVKRLLSGKRNNVFPLLLCARGFRVLMESGNKYIRRETRRFIVFCAVSPTTSPEGLLTAHALTLTLSATPHSQPQEYTAPLIFVYLS